MFYLHRHRGRPSWICCFSLPLFPPILFAAFQRSDFMPPNCALMASFPFPRLLAAFPLTSNRRKYAHAFTVLTLLVLHKLVACMHAQTHTHTNSHWGALKWKRPQALYLLYIIHPPQHKQRRTDVHGKSTQGGQRIGNREKVYSALTRPLSFPHTIHN